MTLSLMFLMIGFGFIAIELLLMQFSVFWFLFFGVGALIASALSWFMPGLSWVVITTVFMVSTALVGVLLYPKLKAWQNKPAPIQGNDALGQTVKVVRQITSSQAGAVTWSGAEWAAETDQKDAVFEPGESAAISRLEGIRLFVVKK